MRFSVVIPVYNVEMYLSEALASVDAQTYTDYEVVLVDDGSTDQSPDICDKFALEARRSVKVIHQENQGRLIARQIGIDASEGEYIVCLDGDDCLRSDALDVINAAINAFHADVVCFGYARTKQFDFRDDLKTAPNKVLSHQQACALFCEKNSLNSMWRKAVARECMPSIQELNHFGRLNIGEDAVQSCLVFDRVKSMVIIHEALYYYRPNDTSVTACFSEANVYDSLRSCAELLKYAKNWSDKFSNNRYYRDMTARCVETLTHFLIHYAGRKSFSEASKAINSVSRAGAIQTCELNNLSKFALHTKLLWFLLRKDHLKAVWVLACVSELLSRR